MRLFLILDILLLTAFIGYGVSANKPPTPVVQGTPYTAPAFDFNVEQGEVTGKVMICRPSATDVKHPDHSDRILRLVCEDGRVVLKLNNVEFPDGFLLRVGPAR